MAPPDRSHASLIPLRCPAESCGARQVRLVVRSRSIATFKCPACGHSWSKEVQALPMKVRATLPRASQVDSKEHHT